MKANFPNATLQPSRALLAASSTFILSFQDNIYGLLKAKPSSFVDSPSGYHVTAPQADHTWVIPLACSSVQCINAQWQEDSNRTYGSWAYALGLPGSWWSTCKFYRYPWKEQVEISVTKPLINWVNLAKSANPNILYLLKGNGGRNIPSVMITSLFKSL